MTVSGPLCAMEQSLSLTLSCSRNLRRLEVAIILGHNGLGEFIISSSTLKGFVYNVTSGYSALITGILK